MPPATPPFFAAAAILSPGFAWFINRLALELLAATGGSKGGCIMDAHRSPTRRVVIPSSDRRTVIDLGRSASTPPAVASDYAEINGACGGGPKPSATLKRRARAAAIRTQRRSPARPSMLQNLIDLIGHDAATALIAAFGGTRVYIPQNPEPADLLSEVIGHRPACALAQIFGGDRLEVPNPPPRRMRILELRRKGLTINAIARTLACTRRRVFQVIAEARTADSKR
jgi:hypothetical protein